VIGRLTLTPGNGDPSTFRTVAPGEFALSVDRRFDDDPFHYVLKGSTGALPAGHTSITVNQPYISWDFSNAPATPRRFDNEPRGSFCCQLLGTHLTASFKASDGSTTQFFAYDFARGTTSHQPAGTNTNLKTTLVYDIGFSHVAMGEWSWRVVDLNGTAAGDFGDLLFVHGDRTPSSGIPASGTATYDARSLALLSSSGAPGIPFTLTADFGQRIMSTRIDQDYRYNSADPLGDPILGIHVSGSAPFGDTGLFDIPLSGTANYAHTNLLTTPPAEAVTGMMNGAFFGPNAEQAGGVFSLQRPNSTLLMQDAFVAKQRQP
jgi:hypothetical protein